nr:LysE/ArgO family amino acid transporter [Brucella thiophenivorans]
MGSSVYATGLMMGLSLIVAIGTQNAFVLRQGLRKEHVLTVVLACAISDAFLIVLGATSFQKIALVMPWLDPVMRYGGAAFLFWYGAKSLYSAIRSSGALASSEISASTHTKTLMTCLALTWLNPHVYLDTVMLLGTISTRFPGKELSFSAGAVTASFLFFFTLGYGAAWLRPIFAKPSSWRILELLIAAIMWLIAIKLIIQA